MIFAVVFAAWASDIHWHLGERYWNLRVQVNPLGDEGLEWIYRGIGEHGGPGAYDYLEGALDDHLRTGGNDVITSGIIHGMVETRDDRARSKFLGLFNRFRGSSPDQRYLALQAAAGLKAFDGWSFSELDLTPAAYRHFGIGSFVRTASERGIGDRRFEDLVAEIGRHYGVP